jgi:radical SAM protein with 4Fe4S-binding SPASM domain
LGERVTVGTLQTFKAVADNPVTRSILKTLAQNCAEDNGNRLEIALELYVGTRKKACLSCRLSQFLLFPILTTGGRAFGVTGGQLKEKFKDVYWRRGLVNVLKGIAWFGVRRPYVPGAPFQVVWNITHACNLKCVHCYESAGAKSKSELSTEEVMRGIDILADAGVLILAFSGGEPTLRPDIVQLINYASKRGLFAALATNAVLLSRQKVRELKKAGLGFAQISLDGLNPRTHDQFRGVSGCFEKTVQGIRNCVSEGLFVEIAATGTLYNYKEIPSMIDFAKELGANWFMLYNFVPTGRGVDLIDSDLSPDMREDILKLCWNRMKETGANVLSTAPQFARVAQQIEAHLISEKKAEHEAHIIPTHFYNPKLPDQLRNLADFIGGCGAGRFYVSLEPNGDIFPCVFFPHSDNMKAGNLYQDNFEDIWRHSKLFWQIRDKDKLKENCGSCPYRYTCGGCRARAYNYFKDILAPDPGCVRNKEHWDKLKVRAKEVQAALSVISK